MSIAILQNIQFQRKINHVAMLTTNTHSLASLAQHMLTYSQTRLQFACNIMQFYMSD